MKSAFKRVLVLLVLSLFILTLPAFAAKGGKEGKVVKQQGKVPHKMQEKEKHEEKHVYGQEDEGHQLEVEGQPFHPEHIGEGEGGESEGGGEGGPPARLRAAVAERDQFPGEGPGALPIRCRLWLQRRQPGGANLTDDLGVVARPLLA